MKNIKANLSKIKIKEKKMKNFIQRDFISSMI